MKKAYRVKKETDFQKIIHQGQSVANRQFVIYSLDKPGQEHFRVGLSVGKKMGNAVQRNAIKRKIRQSLLELEAEIRNEKDFVVIARQPTKKMSVVEMKKSLLHVLKLANVLEN